MKILSFLLALTATGCHGFSERMCDHIINLDCNKPPHNTVVHLCGTDGNTYNSRCSLNKIQCTTNVNLAHVGKCRQNKANGFEKVVCEYIDTIICHGLDPICGTDNVSYDNGCELVKAHCGNHNILEAYQGVCVLNTTHRPVIVDSFCQALMKTPCHGVNPICDMNNVTYDNECEFEKIKCTTPDLHMKKMGVC